VVYRENHPSISNPPRNRNVAHGKHGSRYYRRAVFIPTSRSSEASALGIAIAIHAVTGVYSMPWQDLFSNNFGAHMVAMPLAYMVALTSIFDGNMMERYPKIRLSFMEGGCGWAPYWIRRLDILRLARENSTMSLPLST
jgi:hypothetical protein